VIDELDKEILRILQRKPKAKISEIARLLGRPRSTIAQRVSKLEKEGVIKEYRAIIDPEKVGYKRSALVMVKIRKGIKTYLTQDELAKKIVNDSIRSKDLPFVEEVLILTGAYDMALKVWIKEWKELSSFLLNYLSSMEEIESTETLMVLEKTPETPPPFPL